MERRGASFSGSLVYLLMNFPLGVTAFVVLMALVPAGVGTAVVWVGLPVLMLVFLLLKGAARVERARTYALTDTFVAMPYLPLPEGGHWPRWKARLRDAQTWRDLAYFLLLFPVGVAEFCLLVGFWATSLGLVGLPIYFRYLPDGAWYFPRWDDLRWITVDSTVEALPWAALGVLCVALSVALTKAMAALHTRFAAALLGPTARRRELLEDELVERELSVTSR
ncbi:Putative sensor [Amycolatopsis xylanica]|uniref:Putative sensor n=1 Tax=Amycolatopsis xylanica TaxID=589385 RepID=A0A1H3PQE4_9PSEU|nr:sensor domain-containing protein [Amycolatopsis xylanica]SDZ03287.1 Putative sensor [Amycolatopsis xylanica]